MPDSPVAADSRFMREVNTTAVLAHLRERGRMNLGELSEATGLSRQAVGRALTALRQGGLVELLAPARSAAGPGRPAQLARFRAEAGYVLGALIDPEQVRLALADLRGTIVASSRRALEAGADGATAVSLLTTEAAALLAQAGVGSADVYSAAIGAPGIVDPENGVIRMVPSMSGLGGDIVVRSLAEYLDCPVYLDNDVKLAAEGERWTSVGGRDTSLIVIHWGERIGAGILVDGRLYRGATNDAGDLGFLDLLVPAADRFPAPGLGPFEAWAGSRALVRLASAELARYGQEERSRELLESGDAERVLDAVLAGDPCCTAALRDLAHRFSAGIRALRALLDPHLVVLSGSLARVGEPLLAMIREAHAAYPLELPQLQISSLGLDAVVHGAIRHSLDHLERTRYEPIERRSTELAGTP